MGDILIHNKRQMVWTRLHIEMLKSQRNNENQNNIERMSFQGSLLLYSIS